ncbi:Uncharacterised protein [Metakosakonia massiliensis]|uniref:Uncharacterized protein n=1 Tax=Phytobacter massiliensis TaxID=1485952 RepID=A0A6N3FKK3_9ENTR
MIAHHNNSSQCVKFKIVINQAIKKIIRVALILARFWQ